jgi:hypothetical protein
MAAAAPQAAIFNRIAAASQLIGNTWLGIKREFGGFFAGIAEGVIPIIQGALNMVKGLNLTAIGQKLGEALGDAWGVLVEAFKEGKIGELLSAGFDAAVEHLGNVLFGVLGDGAFWGGIWDVMLGEFQSHMAVIAKAFLNLGNILVATIGQAFDTIISQISKSPKLAKALGIETVTDAHKEAQARLGQNLERQHNAGKLSDAEYEKRKKELGLQQGFGAGSFGERYAEARENSAEANKMLYGIFGGGKKQFAKGFGGIGDAVARANAASGGEAQDRFESLIGGLRRMPKRELGLLNGIGGGGGNVEFGSGLHHKTEGNVFERMGFNGGNVGPAQETAKNTGKLVDLMTQLRNAIMSGDRGLENATLDYIQVNNPL